MAISKTEVRILINEIEKNKGVKFLSPKAFDGLSIDIFKITKNQISISTLKRVWGYIDSTNKVRLSTLDILSKYIGYKHFHDFREHKLSNNNSGYLTEEILLASNLKEGDLVEIGWLPDRSCKLRYEGKNIFSAVSTSNTSLPNDKTFRIHSFALNQPLHLAIIDDVPQNEKNYVAGKKTGLKTLSIINESQ